MDNSSPIHSLPEEVILHILSFLETRNVVRLQSASKLFLRICRDNKLWRKRSFLASACLERVRLQKSGSDWINEGGVSLGHAPGQLRPDTPSDDPNGIHINSLENLGSLAIKRRDREYKRIAANWDTSFPDEKVNWYNEYIHRNAPIAVSWFEQPQIRTGTIKEAVEVSGLAIYQPPSSRQKSFVVAPLIDGTVCLWNIKRLRHGEEKNQSGGKRPKYGSICNTSIPELLCSSSSGNDSSRPSKTINTAVTECVSVDSEKGRAYFAAQSNLIEVDLETLAIVSNQPFEWSITTLSAATNGVPLTVGTIHGLHLYDCRAQYHGRNEHYERIDNDSLCYDAGFSGVLNSRSLPPYAPLARSGPQSILHLEQAGCRDQLSDDIYVAGRFSSILHYDRRMFPAIRGSIYSGGSLCSLASLPHPFSTLHYELRRQFVLSAEQDLEAKNTRGRTVIACGEYNTKGSLELYGLDSAHDRQRSELPCDSVMKNRQTASQSKLLSVITHGNRIVFSDGQGYVNWMERDGFTEVRRQKIGRSEDSVHPSLFGSMPGSDDIARKILSTASEGYYSETPANNDDILFWTGEKLGLLRFSCSPGFSAEDFEEELSVTEDDEKLYHDRMRLALERHARDVQYVQNLGVGNHN
ncbi:hypothetical protein F5Y15DRAFT_409740 [Xylariaceae sp. FL0016]|nr:hypothetical protein F5Y15DRAFT_409740 [Xylariaceae sp. FL0016]